MLANLYHALFGIAVLFSLTLHAQTTYTSRASGSWSTTTNWTPTAPNGGPTLNDHVVIDNYEITLPNADYADWNATGSITIKSGGTLKRTGNLSLVGSGLTIKIENDGELKVTGNLQVENSAKINVEEGGTTSATGLQIGSASTFTVAFNATVNASSLTLTSNTNAVLNNSGTINVSGTVASSGVVNNDGRINTQGDFNVNNNTFTNNGRIDVGPLSTPPYTPRHVTVGSGHLINNGTINVSGNFTKSNNGNQFSNYGQVSVEGNFTAAGPVRLYPGASENSLVLVKGNVSVTSAENLIIGTITNPDPVPVRHADLAIQGNLNQTGSGDVTLNENGRLAVFGDVNLSAGGGTFLIINPGGQVYVDGDGVGHSINVSDGGNHIYNHNPDIDTNGDGIVDTSYGFYVNGTTNSDGSSSIDLIDMEGTNEMEITNPDFFDWVVGQSTGSFSTLPIKLLYFKVQPTAEGNLLEWVTTEEINFHYFELQRASADLIFIKVEHIFSEGGPAQAQRKYTFTDTQRAGKTYYRLKNVDVDGKFTYSNVVVVDGENIAAEVFVYPNPITSNQILNVNLTVKTLGKIELLDARGKSIATSEINDLQNSITLPDSIAPGIYYVRVQDRLSRVIVK